MFRVFLCLFLFAAATAHAQTLTYAVYGGGLHVVDARLTLAEPAGRFDTRVDVTTTGTLARFAPWKALAHSQGWAGAQGWRPQSHEFTTFWKEDVETIQLRYNANGAIIERIVKEKGKKEDRKPADATLAHRALDLPTGILNFLRHRTISQGCEGSFAVYDGQRRFQVILAGQQAQTMQRTRYNIYKGPAISCTVEAKQQGGKWSANNRGWFKIQEDSRKQGHLPRITMAAIPGFASEWLVPVRLDVASPYGAFVMHLTGASSPVK